MVLTSQQIDEYYRKLQKEIIQPDGSRLNSEMTVIHEVVMTEIELAKLDQLSQLNSNIRDVWAVLQTLG